MSAKNLGTLFSNFRHFDPKIVRNQHKKREKTSILFTVNCDISASHSGSNLFESRVCLELILLAVVL